MLVDAWVLVESRGPRISPSTLYQAARLSVWSYLTQRVFKVILQKATPTQIRQLVLYISNSKG